MGDTSQLLYGLYLDPLRMEDVLARCRDALDTRQRLMLGVLNAAKLVNLHRDPVLRDALLECDLLLADGQSVVWASRVLRRPLPERVAGIDVFERLLEMAEAEGRSVYLLGARPAVLERMLATLRQRFPDLRIAGSHHGYFDDAEGAAIASEIRLSQADMLFLGMVSPKKEVFLGTFGGDLDVPVLHGVGGSFDIIAGITRRAPRLWQRLGLEWAYRVVQEPRRMWRRYLVTNTLFLLMTARELVRPAPPLPGSRPHALATARSHPVNAEVFP